MHQTTQQITTADAMQMANAFVTAIANALPGTIEQRSEFAALLHPLADPNFGRLWDHAFLAVKVWLVAFRDETPNDSTRRIVTSAPAPQAWVDWSEGYTNHQEDAALPPPPKGSG